DEECVEDLLTAGARARVLYRADPAENPRTLLHHVGGRVVTQSGDDNDGNATCTFALVDDWDLFNQMLGRPVPGSSLATGQGTGVWAATGPAETVVKALVNANAGSVPYTLTVPASSGRGSTITVNIRMTPLTDRLLPALDFAGIGISARMNTSGGITVDAFAPTTHTAPITERSGLVSGTYAIAAPTATRALVRGGDVSGVPKYRELVATVLEAEWGFTGWTYVEATDTTDNAVMDARAQEALDVAAPKVSLSVELVESDDWRYGVTFGLGDEIPIQMNGAPLITDRVTEVEITQRIGEGLVVTPRIGDHTNTPDQVLVKAIRTLARSARVNMPGRH
ncbi:Gp37-like protein, partial [Cellulomonas rhizosphaerae]